MSELLHFILQISKGMKEHLIIWLGYFWRKECRYQTNLKPCLRGGEGKKKWERKGRGERQREKRRERGRETPRQRETDPERGRATAKLLHPNFHYLALRLTFDSQLLSDNGFGGCAHLPSSVCSDVARLTSPPPYEPVFPWNDLLRL